MKTFVLFAALIFVCAAGHADEPPTSPASEAGKEAKEILRATKKESATPEKISSEIQGVTNALEFYRAEIDKRKKDAEVLAKQKAELTDVVDKLHGERDPGTRRDIISRRDKLLRKIGEGEARLTESEAYLREKQKTVADLEKALAILKQRQQVVYRGYLNRTLIVFGIIAGAFIMNRVLGWVVHRTGVEEPRRQGIERFIRIIITVSAAIALLFMALENFVQTAAVLGVATAGFALAMKDFFSCCLGWFMLVFTRQLKVGDIIQIGEVRGRVIEISLLKTTLVEYDGYRESGRLAYVGNNLIFTHPLFNFGPGTRSIRESIEIVIPINSDWHRARDLATTTAADFTCETAPGPGGLSCEDAAVDMTLARGGILLSLHFSHPLETLPQCRSELLARLVDGLFAAGITPL